MDKQDAMNQETVPVADGQPTANSPLEERRIQMDAAQDKMPLVGGQPAASPRIAHRSKAMDVQEIAKRMLDILDDADACDGEIRLSSEPEVVLTRLKITSRHGCSVTLEAEEVA